jgi:hypothetical protein
MKDKIHHTFLIRVYPDSQLDVSAVNCQKALTHNISVDGG